jgi:6-phosphogluconolactonase
VQPKMTKEYCILSLSFLYTLSGIIFPCNNVEARLMYIGTEANSLYLCNFDEVSGDVTLLTTFDAQYPSFLVLHPSKEYMYSVNEVDSFNGQNNTGGITAYKIDRMNGGIKHINSVISNGVDPAHISVDETGRWIGVANYASGNYGVWKINDDFSLAPKPTTFLQDIGHGPMPQQDGPHAHEFVFGRNNSFVVVPDLGNDSWNQYLFDSVTGSLTAISAIVAPSGSGPRHFAFHPYLPYAYGVSELASTVTIFSAPENLKSLNVIQRISTLPSPQPSAAAELQFSPEGDFLYVSNRLTNTTGSIAAFRIDKANGLLTSIGYYSTLGIQPRFFTLSSDGRFILVANQYSNNTRVFERLETGHIGRLVSTIDGINQPSHILFV